ncbi:MAG: LysR family transcriptional regulator [Casimicrobiaceae bacterium]
MDSRFLDSFVGVIDHGSISEAARRLDLTPAAVAQRIRALEKELGTRLVSRSGRTVKPTEAGARIAARARVVLRDVRDLKSDTADILPGGQLRLGGIATAMTGLLPAALADFVRLQPQLEIYLEPGNSITLYRKVCDGDLDAAVIAQPHFALQKTCDWATFRREPLVVLAPKAMPVADVHTLLVTEPFIRYDRTAIGGRLADTYLRRHGLKPRERFELNALEAIAVMVDRGLGVSLVPDWPLSWPAGHTLVRKPLPHPFAPRCIGLVWSRATARLRLVQSLLGVLKRRSARSAGR